MAWTAPRTYVANEVVTAAILNTDHRDNLLALSTHAHTGAAGDGDDDLTGLDTLTLDDQAANPAVAGRMQRNGNDLYWYGSAVYKITNHTHSTWSNVASGKTDSAETTTNGALTEMLSTGIGTTFGETLSVTFTPSTATHLIHVFGVYVVGNAGAGSITVTIRTLKDSVEQSTVAKVVTGTGGDSRVAPLSIHLFDANPTAASHTYSIEVKTSGGVCRLYAGSIGYQEVGLT